MREKVSKWISLPVKSTFPVAFLYEHLKQPKVKGTNVRVSSHERGCGSCLSLGLQRQQSLSLCTLSDTLFLCNPRHSLPNSPESQPPQSIFCLASLMKLHTFCQITPIIFPYCLVLGCLRSSFLEMRTKITQNV